MEVISIERSTYEELLTSFKSVITKMKEMANRGNGKSLSDWLDNQDVCQMLNISPRALQTLRDNGTLAYSQINRKEWTQMIITDVTYTKKWWKTYTYVTKNHFYNPVKQSLAHTIAIKNLLSQWSALKIVPIVVFTGSAILKDVDSSYDVIYDFNLIEIILAYRTIYLSDSDVQKVVDILLQKDLSEFLDNKEHVNNIYAYRAEIDNKIASGICPNCGGNLVKRTGRFGSFYGCSNYPKCRFTVK